MRKRIIIISLVILVIVFFIGKSIFMHFEKTAKNAIPAPTVEVAKAQNQQWKDQILATGTISAINGVIIKPEAAGRITKIYFKSGSYVKKGDPLFQIYPDILEAQLASNKAALSLARVEYDRAEELYLKKVASKQSLDEQTAKLKSAEAAVAETQAQLVQHNIVAPFSGKIGLKQADIGDYVNVGQSLVPLQQMDPLRVQFSVPDRYINEVKIGDSAAIEVSSASNTIYEGYVYALNSAVNPTTRMFSLWAKIPNPDHSLIPGTYVQITLYSGKPTSVVTVPQTAVVYSPQGQYVYKIVDDVAKKVQVEAGDRKGNLIEITSGLKQDDVVVTAGQVKLYDNMKVKMSDKPTYAPTKPSNVKIITFSDKDLNASDNTSKNQKKDKDKQTSTSPRKSASNMGSTLSSQKSHQGKKATERKVSPQHDDNKSIASTDANNTEKKQNDNTQQQPKENSTQ